MATLRFMGRWVVPVATAASLPVMAPAVLAKADAEEDSRMLKPSELPIYEEPEEIFDYEYHGKERSNLEEGVGSVRKEVEAMLEATRNTRERIIHIYETGKAHTMATVDFFSNFKVTGDYILDEENIIPRAGAITIGGLAGLLVGTRRKGGIFKKFIYTSSGVVVAASLCYPRHAMQVSQNIYTSAKDYGTIGYNFVAGVKPKAPQVVESAKDLASKPEPTPEAAPSPPSPEAQPAPEGSVPSQTVPDATTVTLDMAAISEQAAAAEVSNVGMIQTPANPTSLLSEDSTSLIDTLAQQTSDVSQYGFRLHENKATNISEQARVVQEAEASALVQNPVLEGFGSVDSTKLLEKESIGPLGRESLSTVSEPANSEQVPGPAIEVAVGDKVKEVAGTGLEESQEVVESATEGGAVVESAAEGGAIFVELIKDDSVMPLQLKGDTEVLSALKEQELVADVPVTDAKETRAEELQAAVIEGTKEVELKEQTVEISTKYQVDVILQEATEDVAEQQVTAIENSVEVAIAELQVTTGDESKETVVEKPKEMVLQEEITPDGESRESAAEETKAVVAEQQITTLEEPKGTIDETTEEALVAEHVTSNEELNKSAVERKIVAVEETVETAVAELQITAVEEPKTVTEEKEEAVALEQQVISLEESTVEARVVAVKATEAAIAEQQITAVEPKEGVFETEIVEEIAKKVAVEEQQVITAEESKETDAKEQEISAIKELNEVMPEEPKDVAAKEPFEAAVAEQQVPGDGEPSKDVQELSEAAVSEQQRTAIEALGGALITDHRLTPSEHEDVGVVPVQVVGEEQKEAGVTEQEVVVTEQLVQISEESKDRIVAEVTPVAKQKKGLIDQLIDIFSKEKPEEATETSGIKPKEPDAPKDVKLAMKEPLVDELKDVVDMEPKEIVIKGSEETLIDEPTDKVDEVGIVEPREAVIEHSEIAASKEPKEAVDEPQTVIEKSTEESLEKDATLIEEHEVEVVEKPKVEMVEESKMQIVEESKNRKVIEELKMEVDEEPKMEVDEEPKMGVIEEPRVEVIEEPKVEVVEEPKVEVIEEPKVKVIEDPKVEVVKEPKLATVEESEEALLEPPVETPMEESKESLIEPKEQIKEVQPKRVGLINQLLGLFSKEDFSEDVGRDQSKMAADEHEKPKEMVEEKPAEEATVIDKPKEFLSEVSKAAEPEALSEIPKPGDDSELPVVSVKEVKEVGPEDTEVAAIVEVKAVVEGEPKAAVTEELKSPVDIVDKEQTVPDMVRRKNGLVDHILEFFSESSAKDKPLEDAKDTVSKGMEAVAEEVSKKAAVTVEESSSAGAAEGEPKEVDILTTEDSKEIIAPAAEHSKEIVAVTLEELKADADVIAAAAEKTEEAGGVASVPTEDPKEITLVAIEGPKEVDSATVAVESKETGVAAAVESKEIVAPIVEFEGAGATAEAVGAAAVSERPEEAASAVEEPREALFAVKETKPEKGLINQLIKIFTKEETNKELKQKAVEKTIIEESQEEKEVVTEEPKEVVKEPEEVVTVEPMEVVTEEPKEIVTEEPKEVVTEEPKEVVAEEPKEGVIEELKKVIVEEPKEVAAEEPKPVSIEVSETEDVGQSKEMVVEQLKQMTAEELKETDVSVMKAKPRKGLIDQIVEIFTKEDVGVAGQDSAEKSAVKSKEVTTEEPEEVALEKPKEEAVEDLKEVSQKLSDEMGQDESEKAAEEKPKTESEENFVVEQKEVADVIKEVVVGKKDIVTVEVAEKEDEKLKEISSKLPKEISDEIAKDVTVQEPEEATLEVPKEVAVEMPKEIMLEKPKEEAVKESKEVTVVELKEVVTEEAKVSAVEVKERKGLVTQLFEIFLSKEQVPVEPEAPIKESQGVSQVLEEVQMPVEAPKEPEATVSEPQEIPMEPEAIKVPVEAPKESLEAVQELQEAEASDMAKEVSDGDKTAEVPKKGLINQLIEILTANEDEKKQEEGSEVSKVEKPVVSELIEETLEVLEENVAKDVAAVASEVEEQAEEVVAVAAEIDRVAEDALKVAEIVGDVVTAAAEAAEVTPGLPEPVDQMVDRVAKISKVAAELAGTVIGISGSIKESAASVAKVAEAVKDEATLIKESKEERQNVLEKVEEAVTGAVETIEEKVEQIIGDKVGQITMETSETKAEVISAESQEESLLDKVIGVFGANQDNSTVLQEQPEVSIDVQHSEEVGEELASVEEKREVSAPLANQEDIAVAESPNEVGETRDESLLDKVFGIISKDKSSSSFRQESVSEVEGRTSITPAVDDKIPAAGGVALTSQKTVEIPQVSTSSDGTPPVVQENVDQTKLENSKVKSSSVFDQISEFFSRDEKTVPELRGAQLTDTVEGSDEDIVKQLEQNVAEQGETSKESHGLSSDAGKVIGSPGVVQMESFENDPHLEVRDKGLFDRLSDLVMGREEKVSTQDTAESSTSEAESFTDLSKEVDLSTVSSEEIKEYHVAEKSGDTRQESSTETKSESEASLSKDKTLMDKITNFFSKAESSEITQETETDLATDGKEEEKVFIREAAPSKAAVLTEAKEEELGSGEAVGKLRRGWFRSEASITQEGKDVIIKLDSNVDHGQSNPEDADMYTTRS